MNSDWHTPGCHLLNPKSVRSVRHLLDSPSNALDLDIFGLWSLRPVDLRRRSFNNSMRLPIMVTNF
jgi:hypothetical protein